MDISKKIEIAKDIYWVGINNKDEGLNCNPYLLIDGDEAILIDPGSVLDFEYVFKKVCNIVPLENIKYVILHHQDPDLCSSVPLFEEKGANFKIVTHWRTKMLVKYYGVKSEYYIVNENDYKLELKSGRILSFIQTPYLHFPGAIVTYDKDSRILFSSDLFGSISSEWSLYADDNYIENMKTFHEHYMPSNAILRPVMEMLLDVDISIIAPQHGSIINKDIVKYIKTLRDLECGSFLSPIKKDLAKSGGYMNICSKILKRYSAIFSKEEVIAVIDRLDIKVDRETMEIIDYNYTGYTLWNNIFNEILSRKGISWLLVVEPLVNRLSKEYDIPMPEVFMTQLIKSEKDAIILTKEIESLRKINSRLKNNLKSAQDKLTRCPIIGLYNYDFFKNYVSNELEAIIAEGFNQNCALILISLDNTSSIRYPYGDDEVDDVLKNISYIIDDLKEENDMLFRLEGPTIACYIPHISRNESIEFSEQIRNHISSSERFIENITVSIGVTSLEEVTHTGEYSYEVYETFYNMTLNKLNFSKKEGGNIVTSNTDIGQYHEDRGSILIIDKDEIDIDVIRTFLENLNFEVLSANDGEKALEIVDTYKIDLIISEIMIPKLDGFLVRERLLSHSSTKNIPFIIISSLKDSSSLERALSLGINHYFKKPFLIAELIGIVKNKVKRKSE